MSTVIKYPLDLTGTASSNLVSGEVHDLSSLPANQQRAFVLNYGPFYTTGLVVTNVATGQPLTPSTVGVSGQYVATQLFADMTLRTGKDICAVIVITDTTLPSNLQVSVTAQMLGGEYSNSVDAIQQLIDALNLGNQPVLWGDILGKPVLFPPAPHLHDLGDVYGFEYITAALERIVQAIYVGDSAQLEAIYQYIDHETASLQGGIAANSSAITAHLADFTNPHRVTAAQVGLGNVANYPIATTAQAQAGTANNVYLTPYLVSQYMTGSTGFGTQLQAHINNTSNPHSVTQTQVGLGSVQNYPIATTAQAQTGTATNAYMTPLTTAAAITTQALGPLNTHINNTSNPHQVTSTQVGLGNVQNYGMATNSDGQTGTSTTLYMSPATTTAAIASQVGNAFNAHIANTSNPHAVTAAQVGLGSVNNTSDLAKPISTATQTALNNKATLGAEVTFGSVHIGTGQGFIYESTANAITIRTGTSSALKYATISAAGALSVQGKVTGTSFQPSDRRLKKHIKKAEARPLWQNLTYKTWDWRDVSKGSGRGTIAQEAQVAYPEYVGTFDHYDGKTTKTYLDVDQIGMAFEMAVCAGRTVDRLTQVVEQQAQRIAQLEAQL